jgi:hypothetical protein
MRANRPQNSDVPDPSPTRISNCNLRLKKSALQLGPTDPTWARALPNAARPRTSISARWASRDQVPRGPMPVADDNILYRLVNDRWGVRVRLGVPCGRTVSSRVATPPLADGSSTNCHTRRCYLGTETDPNPFPVAVSVSTLLFKCA